MKYTQIPTNTFSNMQMNAGILVDNFDPATGEVGNIIGATTGGISFSDSPEYSDMGENIDNAPKNTKELKRLTSRDIKLSGTFVTIDSGTAKDLIGAADIDALDTTHIIPRVDVLQTDFKDMWWIGDYSDKNTGANAGHMALHMMNTLSTAGLQIQSTDKETGEFAFEFTAHPTLSNQDLVPYEVYIKHGVEEVTPNVLLDKHAVSVTEGHTITLNASTIPTGKTVTFSSSNTSVVTVTSAGVVEGVAEGNAIITATITVDGVDYTDTCTVVVTAL